MRIFLVSDHAHQFSLFDNMSQVVVSVLVACTEMIALDLFVHFDCFLELRSGTGLGVLTCSYRFVRAFEKIQNDPFEFVSALFLLCRSHSFGIL